MKTRHVHYISFRNSKVKTFIDYLCTDFCFKNSLFTKNSDVKVFPNIVNNSSTENCANVCAACAIYKNLVKSFTVGN